MEGHIGEGSPVDTGEALWIALQGQNIIRVLSEE